MGIASVCKHRSARTRRRANSSLAGLLLPARPSNRRPTARSIRRWACQGLSTERTDKAVPAALPSIAAAAVVPRPATIVRHTRHTACAGRHQAENHVRNVSNIKPQVKRIYFGRGPADLSRGVGVGDEAVDGLEPAHALKDVGIGHRMASTNQHANAMT